MIQISQPCFGWIMKITTQGIDLINIYSHVKNQDTSKNKKGIKPFTPKVSLLNFSIAERLNTFLLKPITWYM
ncbi:hypothetical protein [Photobacterium lutimaris]|uniref:Uncharacterized protein n=1 Tax=Photobacterium lutimaris TaxID=388278 RepID=A0A2T3J0J5_9GAMM|nr:hypothetical protein [Photobacterium lutimaris]PSU34612.1 hypothetical protein C9I99_05795 [Photobacterium lutimaris]